MIDIDEYMRKNPLPVKEKQSKLFKFENEIKKLREAGATYGYIQSFLANYGVKSSIENIRQFLIRTGNGSKKPNTTKKTLPQDKTKQAKLQDPAITPAEKKGEEKPHSPLDDYEPPKWAGDIDVKKLF